MKREMKIHILLTYCASSGDKFKIVLSAADNDFTVDEPVRSVICCDICHVFKKGLRDIFCVLWTKLQLRNFTSNLNIAKYFPEPFCLYNL